MARYTRIKKLPLQVDNGIYVGTTPIQAIDENGVVAQTVPYTKRSSVATGAATADGTGSGTIPAGTTFFTATSDGATKQVKLPAATASLIGQTVDVYIGANGCELITATSAHTINGADADGTNQLDLAANTVTRFIQVTATGWIAYQVAYTTITSFAADND